MAQNTQQQSTRRVMWLFMVLFITPIFLATILYSIGFRPQGTKQHGELIQPAHALHKTDWQVGNGSWPTQKWQILFNQKGSCDDSCEHTLHMMRQVHTALGKEAPRVERTWLVDETTDWKGQVDVYPALRVLRGDWPQWLKDRQGVWLVDPMGHVMMYYAPGAPEKGWLKDLKHLLKISTVG